MIDYNGYKLGDAVRTLKRATAMDTDKNGDGMVSVQRHGRPI